MPAVRFMPSEGSCRRAGLSARRMVRSNPEQQGLDAMRGPSQDRFPRHSPRWGVAESHVQHESAGFYFQRDYVESDLFVLQR